MSLLDEYTTPELVEQVKTSSETFDVVIDGEVFPIRVCPDSFQASSDPEVSGRLQKVTLSFWAENFVVRDSRDGDA